MKKILLLSRTSIACLTLAVFPACNKEKVFDMKGDTLFKVFFNETSGNNFTGSLQVSPIGPLGKFKAAWPAHRTANEENECKVTVGVDNSLIDSYNAKNKTVYKAFPEGTLTFVNTVTLGPGQSISSDSIKISLDESKTALLIDTLYLAPVKILSLTSGAISSNLNTVYVRLSVFKTNCYVRTKKADMKGSPIADRTNWTATTTLNGSIGGSLSNMFDRNEDTAWSYQIRRGLVLGFPFEVTVDMKTKVDNIEGLRLSSCYHYFLGNLYVGVTEAQVLSSDDGLAWTSQGTTEMAPGPTDGFAVYIRFYNTISAQYIKLKIKATAYNNIIHMAEWDTFVSK